MCGTCQSFNPFEPDCFLTHEAGGATSWQTITETTDAVGSVAVAGVNYSIDVGDSFDGFLSADDTDLVAIELVAGQTYTFDLGASVSQSNDVQDTFLGLLDSNGSYITGNDDVNYAGGNLYSSLSFTATTSGTYYLEISTYKTTYAVTSAPDDVGYYTLDTAVVGQAAPMTAFTLDQIADQLNYGGWGNQSYAWNVSPGQSLTVNLVGLTAEGQSLARYALEAWTAVLGINFTEVSLGGQITFDDNNSGAYASFSVSGGYISSASINVSTSWIAAYGTNLNGYSFQTYIHEVGHALGLAHGGNYNGSADYGVDNHYLNDSWQQSIMSYFSQNENTYVDASFAYVITPQMADILAAQELYGVAGTIRTGDTTYGANSSVGGYYDQISVLSNTAFTILDDGGTDTLDTSTYSGTQTVRMEAETYSDIFGETGNLAIARGTTLENFEGGSGADTVFGNDVANTINANNGADEVYAGGGDDSVNGGAGHDRLVGNEGNDTLNGGEGNDILRGKSGSNELNGEGGDDNIRGSDTGNDLITGGLGSDTISGLAGDDTINGDDNNDFIYAGQGADLVYGGDGEDRIRGNRDDDTLYGGADTDHIFGGLGYDLIFGGTGQDYLYGEGGNDTLDGGTDRDALTGGGGVDTFVFALGYGFDRVLDFENGLDRFDVSSWGLTGFGDLTLEARGAHTRVNFGSGDVIYVENMLIAEFDAADFIFV